MLAILFVFGFMPHISPSLQPTVPQVSKSLTESVCGVCTPASNCGCLSGGPCLCRKYASYAEWRLVASRKRKKPAVVVPISFVVPLRAATFANFTSACAGGG